MKDLIAIDAKNIIPEKIFDKGLDSLLSEIESEARSVVADVSTAKGRKEIASMANRVARSKTYLDGLGKELVSGWKAQAAKVDAERRKLRERLDKLKAEVREPLTEWEEVERVRVDTLRARLAKLDRIPEILPSGELERQLEIIEHIIIDDSWDEFVAEAAKAKDAAVTRWRKAIDQAKQDEAERKRAEIARREEEKRKAAERERIIAERAAREERERAEAQIEMKRKLAEIKVRNAEEKAREAEARAKRAVESERKRVEIEKKRKEEEAKKREMDKKHRQKIDAEASASLVYAGINLGQAKKIVGMIRDGKVPHITILY